jgi:Mg2+ and Co2+ transporter CorA
MAPRRTIYWSLSTESERLERQAIETPNFNTLKRLVECRRTTRKLQDSLKNLQLQMPPMTLG